MKYSILPYFHIDFPNFYDSIGLTIDSVSSDLAVFDPFHSSTRFFTLNIINLSVLCRYIL